MRFNSVRASEIPYCVFLSAFICRICDDEQYALKRYRGEKKYARLRKFAKSRRLHGNTSYAQNDADSFELCSRVEVGIVLS
jgi:hypothetical protein